LVVSLSADAGRGVTGRDCLASARLAPHKDKHPISTGIIPAGLVIERRFPGASTPIGGS
jgi:hypothetical protein